VDHLLDAAGSRRTGSNSTASCDPEHQTWQAGGAGPAASGSGNVSARSIAARGHGLGLGGRLGVHLHTEACEHLAARIGAVGYLTTELLNELPQYDQISQ
jgi:hypothetical protein